MIKEKLLPPGISVSSTTNSPFFLQKAEQLSRKLGLCFVRSPQQSRNELLLCYTPEGLKLLLFNKNKNRLSPLLFVDFVGGKHGFRLSRNRTINQPLAKAVGIKSGIRPTVLDTTAGLGGDSFVLASLGCKVTLCERNPIIAALLADGLKRAAADVKTADIAKSLTLYVENSEIILAKQASTFQTVYLDPMYPHRKSSALNKQAMRIIRTIVGDDIDSTTLFNTAINGDVARIAVKRPLDAPTLSDGPPDHVIKMKSNRFDIYFPHRK